MHSVFFPSGCVDWKGVWLFLVIACSSGCWMEKQTQVESNKLWTLRITIQSASNDFRLRLFMAYFYGGVLASKRHSVFAQMVVTVCSLEVLLLSTWTWWPSMQYFQAIIEKLFLMRNGEDLFTRLLTLYVRSNSNSQVCLFKLLQVFSRVSRPSILHIRFADRFPALARTNKPCKNVWRCYQGIWFSSGWNLQVCINRLCQCFLPSTFTFTNVENPVSVIALQFVCSYLPGAAVKPRVPSVYSLEKNPRKG